MRLALIPIATLALLLNLNSQTPNLDTHRSNSVVSSFIKGGFNLNTPFPDRTVQITQAQELDKQREEARLEAIKAEQARITAEAQKNVPQTPQIAPSGSCRDWIVQAGVVDVENAYYLIMKESGCNPNSVNKSSGACGIPQALPCSKLGTSDPIAQIQWMQNYCIRRYGSWAGAVAHSKSVGWY